ncbi:MAG: hypothetical protein KAI64_03350, partial [Thermoplasmata archaeon]|nr:hypothetical protein [Thermoplasmata archaeon]
NIDSAASPEGIAGIMLLNDAGENLEEDGWRITGDPNGNSDKFNYNEMTGLSGDTSFTWLLKASPDEGNYTIIARLIYTDGSAYYVDSDGLDISVVAPPPQEGDGQDTNGDLEPAEGISVPGMVFGLVLGLVSAIIFMALRRR